MRTFIDSTFLIVWSLFCVVMLFNHVINIFYFFLVNNSKLEFLFNISLTCFYIYLLIKYFLLIRSLRKLNNTIHSNNNQNLDNEPLFSEDYFEEVDRMRNFMRAFDLVKKQNSYKKRKVNWKNGL